MEPVHSESSSRAGTLVLDLVRLSIGVMATMQDRAGVCRDRWVSMEHLLRSVSTRMHLSSCDSLCLNGHVLSDDAVEAIKQHMHTEELAQYVDHPPPYEGGGYATLCNTFGEYVALVYGTGKAVCPACRTLASVKKDALHCVCGVSLPLRVELPMVEVRVEDLLRLPVHRFFMPWLWARTLAAGMWVERGALESLLLDWRKKNG